MVWAALAPIAQSGQSLLQMQLDQFLTSLIIRLVLLLLRPFAIASYRFHVYLPVKWFGALSLVGSERGCKNGAKGQEQPPCFTHNYILANSLKRNAKSWGWLLGREEPTKW